MSSHFLIAARIGRGTRCSGLGRAGGWGGNGVKPGPPAGPPGLSCVETGWRLSAVRRCGWWVTVRATDSGDSAGSGWEWGAGMPYTVLRGRFVIRYPDLPRQGPEPDGDTVKFVPDTPALVEGLPRRSGRPPEDQRPGGVGAAGSDRLHLAGVTAHPHRRVGDPGGPGSC
jgi:hypothetical protein